MNQAAMSQPQQSQQQTFGSGSQINGQNVPQQNVPQQNVRQSNGNFAQQGSMPGNSNQQVASQPRANNGLAPNSGGNMGTGSAQFQNTGAETSGQTQLSALQMLASISGDAAQPQVQAQEQTVTPIANQPAQAPMDPTATAVEVPEFTTAASQTAGSHVGTWAVSLPGNQTIVLALNNDNSFSWNASKDGKQSSFQGQYRLEGSRLTLVRSNDLQQMAGSWNGSDANFTFKLDGATTSGLAFTRN